jgi:hypothetical protein
VPWPAAVEREISASPYDVVFSNFDVVEPDLLYLSNERRAQAHHFSDERGAGLLQQICAAAPRVAGDGLSSATARTAVMRSEIRGEQLSSTT